MPSLPRQVLGILLIIGGLLGFLPGSQADLRPIRNMDEMVNKTYEFKILKYNKKRNNIVLSRRVLLEAERDKLRSTTLEAIEEGKVMEGIVKNITEYGVFVDLGGVDGLLHITDISWGRVKHPSELFSVGDKINVKILSFDIEKERVFKREDGAKWRCRNCGYSYEGDGAPAQCPACAHAQAHFELKPENY